MKKFIHLGMPKALSSALQTGFFSKHKSIHYLGVGVGSMIDYINDPINIIFDTLIPFANNDYYELSKSTAINTFNMEVDKARALKKKWVGISGECLGVNITPEMVDPSLKVKRLTEIVGSDAKIIMITRNNFPLLKSLWTQLVKEGLSKSFAEYCQYLWDFRDRSCLNEILYDLQYLRLVQAFGKNNVAFIPLEFYREANGHLSSANHKIELISKLSKLLDIEYPSNFDLPVINPSMDNRELFHKLRLNKQYRHCFGNLIFEPSNLHRSRKQLELFGAAEGQDLFREIKLKRRLLEQAKKAAKEQGPEISFALPEKLSSNLYALFRESNQNFEKVSGIKLPQEYFCTP